MGTRLGQRRLDRRQVAGRRFGLTQKVLGRIDDKGEVPKACQVGALCRAPLTRGQPVGVVVAKCSGGTVEVEAGLTRQLILLSPAQILFEDAGNLTVEGSAR